MSNKMNDVTPCRMQPDNMGLSCNDPEIMCKNCGWNPTVAKQRRRKTEEKIREQEK